MTEPKYDSSGEARRALSDIIARQGRAGIDDARLVGSLLPDLLPGNPPEAKLLQSAAGFRVGSLLDERIQLMAPDAAVRDVALILAAQDALDLRACMWVVGEYALALGYPLAISPTSSAPNEPTILRGRPPAPVLVAQPMPETPTADQQALGRTPTFPDPQPLPPDTVRRSGDHRLAIVALVIAVAAIVVVAAVFVSMQPRTKADGASAAGPTATTSVTTVVTTTPPPITIVTTPTVTIPSSTPVAGGDSGDFPPSFVGSWAGIMQQSNNESWTTLVHIDADSYQGTVSYPQLSCSGVWTLVSSEGSTLTVREQITVNVKKCTQFGTVYLTPHSDGSWEVQYTPDSHHYSGVGTLNRS